MNSHASWDLDWNKSSDVDFDIKFTINPDTLEKKALLRFRRISIDGKPGEWTYAGYDSWKMFSKEQKCKLQQDLKEYGSMLSKFSKCDDFIKLIEESLYPNDYISIDYLMMGKLLGLTSALNEKKIKFDGREKRKI